MKYKERQINNNYACKKYKTLTMQFSFSIYKIKIFI